MKIEYLIEGLLVFLLGVALVVISYTANAGIVMKVEFYDGSQVTRQFSGEDEFLMTFQAREHCAPGWEKLTVTREEIKGFDDE